MYLSILISTYMHHPYTCILPSFRCTSHVLHITSYISHLTSVHQSLCRLTSVHPSIICLFVCPLISSPDVIDIVNDSLSGSDYLEEEDPSLYHSMKTGRGPLPSDWIENPPNGVIMCAYKLIKVTMTMMS